MAIKDKKGFLDRFGIEFTNGAMGGTSSGSLLGKNGIIQARKDFISEHKMTPREYKNRPSIDQKSNVFDFSNILSGQTNYIEDTQAVADSQLQKKYPSLGATLEQGIVNNYKNNIGGDVRVGDVGVGKETAGGKGMGMSSSQMGAIGDMAGGVASVISGVTGGGKRRAEQAAAESEYNTFKNRFDNLSTANVYSNLNNPYEDLTVNKQQANFVAQQQQQGLANTMRSLQGAAGGSGIAALAQAMSNQQGQNLQQASASIGQQESANQRLRAQGAMQTQMAERQGELISNQMEAQKTAAQLGRSDERLREANLAREQATKALVGGVAQLGMGVASGGAAGMFGDAWFDGSR